MTRSEGAPQTVIALASRRSKALWDGKKSIAWNWDCSPPSEILELTCEIELQSPTTAVSETERSMPIAATMRQKWVRQ
eukprot:4168163-Pyramimonas_sp.AAC.1